MVHFSEKLNFPPFCPWDESRLVFDEIDSLRDAERSQMLLNSAKTWKI